MILVSFKNTRKTKTISMRKWSKIRWMICPRWRSTPKTLKEKLFWREKSILPSGKWATLQDKTSPTKSTSNNKQHSLKQRRTTVTCTNKTEQKLHRHYSPTPLIRAYSSPHHLWWSTKLTSIKIKTSRKVHTVLSKDMDWTYGFISLKPKIMRKVLKGRRGGSITARLNRSRHRDIRYQLRKSIPKTLKRALERALILVDRVSSTNKSSLIEKNILLNDYNPENSHNKKKALYWFR